MDLNFELQKQMRRKAEDSLRHAQQAAEVNRLENLHQQEVTRIQLDRNQQDRLNPSLGSPPTFGLLEQERCRQQEDMTLQAMHQKQLKDLRASHAAEDLRIEGERRHEDLLS